MAKAKTEATTTTKAPHMVRVMHGDLIAWANSTKKAGEYRCTKCGQTGHPIAKA